MSIFSRVPCDMPPAEYEFYRLKFVGGKSDGITRSTKALPRQLTRDNEVYERTHCENGWAIYQPMKCD